VRGLTSRNSRTNAWAARHPWAYGVIYATAFVGMLALTGRDNVLDAWRLLAGTWVVMVLVGGLLGKLLPPKKASPIGSSLPPGAGAMDEDGARHRQGLP
jgi:hypothetical protein